MLKAVLYTQVEGAEFYAWRVWEQEFPTKEELESIRADARSMVILRGIPVHAVFFIYQDLSIQRWDCINGFTKIPSDWNGSNPVYRRNMEYLFRQYGDYVV